MTAACLARASCRQAGRQQTYPGQVAHGSALRGCERTPPPDPLPETERGRKKKCSVFLPLSVSGRGSGGGVLSHALSLPPRGDVSRKHCRMLLDSSLGPPARQDRLARRPPVARPTATTPHLSPRSKRALSLAARIEQEGWTVGAMGAGATAPRCVACSCGSMAVPLYAWGRGGGVSAVLDGLRAAGYRSFLDFGKRCEALHPEEPMTKTDLDSYRRSRWPCGPVWRETFPTWRRKLCAPPAARAAAACRTRRFTWPTWAPTISSRSSR